MTRRTRGSAKERAKLLQAQLDHAQMLLRTAGVLDPTVATPASQPHDNTQTCIDVLLQAASLPSNQPDLINYSQTISHNNTDQCQALDQPPSREPSRQDEAENTVSYLFSPQLSLGTDSAQMSSISNGHANSEVLPTTTPDTRRETVSSTGCATNSSHERDPLDTIIEGLGQIESRGSVLFQDDEVVPEVEEPVRSPSFVADI